MINVTRVLLAVISQIGTALLIAVAAIVCFVTALIDSALDPIVRLIHMVPLQ